MVFYWSITHRWYQIIFIFNELILYEKIHGFIVHVDSRTCVFVCKIKFG